MNDDELLRALAAEARRQQAQEQETLDERWDALAAGRLGEADRERLLEDAAASGDAAQAYEAFRPLDARFRAQVVDRLTADGTATDPGEDTAEQHSPPTGARVIPLRRRQPPRWLPLAMAAGLLVAVGGLWFLPPSGGGPLPGYSVRFEGDLKEMRGADTEPADRPLVYAQGNRLRLVLTPDTSVQGALEVRAYAQSGARLERLEIPIASVSGDGAVLVEGVVGGGLELPQGRSALVIVVGRPDALPDATELQQALGNGAQASGRQWRAWRQPLERE